MIDLSPDFSTQFLDPAYIQFPRSAQLQQFVRADDITAIQTSIRNMPGIVLEVVQSNRESLSLKLRQRGLELYNRRISDYRLCCIHGLSLAENELGDCALRDILHTPGRP